MKSFIVKLQLIIILVFGIKVTSGQQIIVKNDTISTENDSVATLVLPEYRGELHWQVSYDQKEWITFFNEINDSLIVDLDMDAWYRAAIIEGTCDTAYSDTAYVINSIPIVVTDSVRNVSYNSALLGGMIINIEEVEILEKGVCLSEHENPTIDDFKFIVETDTSEYVNTINGLHSNTIYFYRAYAINSKGIFYGEIFQFKTELLTFSVSKHIMASEGDTIIAPDGSTLFIPGNSLCDNGEVIFETTNYMPILNSNLKHVGETYKIVLPCDSLENNIYLSYKIPLLNVPIDQYSLFLYNGETFYPMDYLFNGDTVTAIIDITKWDVLWETKIKNAKFLGELVLLQLVHMQTPSDKGMHLKEIKLSGDNFEFFEPNDTQKSKIILFIHGWTGNPETWNYMIPKFMSETNFENTKFWTFGYNSSLGIEYNASLLYDSLLKYSKGTKIDIVAHSMGGLVARSMIEKFGGKEFVNKLITVGTPHLGSPLAALRDFVAVGILSTSIFPSTFYVYNIATQGFKDLQQNSTFIKNLRILSKPTIPYYLLAAINSIDNPLIEGNDDGIVGLSSAFGVQGCKKYQWNPLEGIEVHRQMVRENVFYQDILGILLHTEIKIDSIFDITQTTACYKYSTEARGISEIITKGICWSLGPNPSILSDSITFNSDSTNFIGYITDLEPNTKYFVRAFSYDGTRTSYSDTISFKTLPLFSQPTVMTSSATSITSSTSTLNSEVTSDGGAPITQRGFYWCENCDEPGEGDSIALVDGTTGSFSYQLTNLKPKTHYAFAAFATNSIGTGTGDVFYFATDAEPQLERPQLVAPEDYSVYNRNTTENITIQWNNVTGADEYWLNVFPDGQPASPVFNTSVGSAINKTIPINTLPNGIYRVQVKARKTGGEWTEYSDARQFIADTPANAPELSAPENQIFITRNTWQNFSWTAPSAGIDRYNIRIVSGTNLDNTPFYNEEPEQLSDSVNCTGEPGTYTWSVRAMKETPAGYSATTYESTIGWGSYAPVRTFEIIEEVSIPTVIVDPGPSNITSTSALVSGVVVSDGNAPVTERGFCWGTSNNPTLENYKLNAGSGTGAFSGTITGLTEGIWYYRSYAINIAGIAYSDTSITFTVQPEANQTGTFTDSRDGNTYKWVKIGEQVWMAENLAYLPEVNVPDGESRYHDSIPVYYVYGYYGTNVEEAEANPNYATYGVLYNYVAALEVCPNGWHLPSAGEWEQLAQYISDTKGPYETDGVYFFNRSKHLKATYGWDNNGNGLDDFGFSALPGGQYGSGYVQDSLQFGGIGNSGYWRSDSKSWFMYHFTETLYGAALDKQAARSIRCIKD